MLALLAGCTPKDAEPPVLTQVAVFRDPSAQIASQTNVTADRMAGEWVVRQRVPSQSWTGDTMTFSMLPNGALELATPVQICDTEEPRRDCSEGRMRYLLEKTGPGRWAVQRGDTSTGSEIWVMWMDFDTRTAAIGTPSGEFGWIMDKAPTGGGDRITAARDIMDWFGYDVSQITDVRQ